MLADRRALLDPDPAGERFTAIHVKKVAQYPVIGKEFKSYGLQVQGVEIPCRTWYCKALTGKKFRYFQFVSRIDETERVKFRLAHRYTPVIAPGGKKEIAGFIQELQRKYISPHISKTFKLFLGNSPFPGCKRQVIFFFPLINHMYSYFGRQTGNGKQRLRIIR